MKFDRRSMWSLILTAYWTAHAFQFRPDIDLSLIGIGFPGGVLIAMASNVSGGLSAPTELLGRGAGVMSGVILSRGSRDTRRHSCRRRKSRRW